MKGILSKALRILAWIVCVLSCWMSLVSLSFFNEGLGWAGIGLVVILEYYLPGCLLGCIGPLAYRVYRYREARDIRSLQLAGFSTLLLMIVAGLAFWLAPAGNGC